MKGLSFTEHSYEEKTFMAVCFAYSSKKCKCGWTRLSRKCSGDTVAPAWKFTEPQNKHYMKYCGRLFQATY